MMSVGSQNAAATDQQVNVDHDMVMNITHSTVQQTINTMSISIDLVHAALIEVLRMSKSKCGVFCFMSDPNISKGSQNGKSSNLQVQ